MKLVIGEEKIDRIEWSSFVAKHPHGNIFQTPEIYDVFKLTKNYTPFIFTVYNDNCLEGLLLAVVQKDYREPVGMLTSRCIVWGGPLIAHGKNYSIIFKQIMRVFHGHVKNKAIYTQFRNIFDMTEKEDLFKEQNYSKKDHLNYLLNLSLGKDDLWISMNKKRRNSIKKAIKSGIVVKSLDDISSVEDSYNVIKRVYDKAKIPLADISLFMKTFENLQNKKMLKCFAAYLDETMIGTVWLLTFRGRVYDWYSGSLSQFLNKAPNDLMLWKSIEWSIDKNYEIFDFGGAGSPEKKYGVRDFKRKFGGDELNLGRFNLINSKFKYALSNELLNYWKIFRQKGIKI